MRLGIDMDGVTCRFNDGWTALHRAEFGSDVHAGQIVGWDGLHAVGGFADMDEFWAWAGPQPHRPSVFRHLEPYPGAVETIRRLGADGHDVVVITAKPQWAVPDTLRWLADHDLPITEVHFVDNKAAVPCDVYVDDADHNLAEIAAAHPGAAVLRMVRPWNSPGDEIQDVTEWNEIYEVVTSLSRGSDVGGVSIA